MRDNQLQIKKFKDHGWINGARSKNKVPAQDPQSARSGSNNTALMYVGETILKDQRAFNSDIMATPIRK